MTNIISTTVPILKPVWLVTGCSTGFGRELASHLLDLGHRTVVTARNPEDVEDLSARGDVLVLKLDVTDSHQVDAAIRATEARFGGVDVLVNNAGIGYFAAVEEGEEGMTLSGCSDCCGTKTGVDCWGVMGDNSVE